MTVIIDYLRLSLGVHKTGGKLSTQNVLTIFSNILPEKYINTCKDAIFSDGKSARISQYGICVQNQYGSGKGVWSYSVSLSGSYWHAINYNREPILEILENFERWRISRLDLACDVCVPMAAWQKYYKGAFNSGNHAVAGVANARTVYYGSRKSMFFTRIYNKTASDPKHHPAPDGKIQVRFEVEVKRIQGELALKPAFLDPEYAEKLFIQRVRYTAKEDGTGFISRYFDINKEVKKIKTVERVMGDFEGTVEFVIKKYEDYILAAMKSETIKKRLKEKPGLSKKSKKVLAVLDNIENKK